MTPSMTQNWSALSKLQLEQSLVRLTLHLGGLIVDRKLIKGIHPKHQIYRQVFEQVVSYN